MICALRDLLSLFSIKFRHPPVKPNAAWNKEIPSPSPIRKTYKCLSPTPVVKNIRK